MNAHTRIVCTTLAALSLGACSPRADSGAAAAPEEVAAPTHSAPAAAAQSEPATPADAGTDVGTETLQMVVHKSATCGCCELWVEHMQAAGFQVEVRNTENLGPIKEEAGVPVGKGSCHTAQIGGYFIEGHVPAEDVKRLLAQRPDAKGLVLPGMPAGSPGMEMPDGRTEPYTVELVHADGTTAPFAQHGN